MRLSRLIFLGCAVLLAGCNMGTFPDPNDPKDVGPISVDNLFGQYNSISELLQQRVGHAQISQADADAALREAAVRLLKGFSTEKVEASKAWQVARMMIDVQQWANAKPMLEVAVEWAKTSHNEDRRVNDTLQLARAQANLGDVSAAVKTARKTFDAAPANCAPIPFSVLYEIVPGGRGKGHDIELARLLEDAIVIDTKVVVNTQTEGGIRFLQGRPRRMRESWNVIHALYADAKRPDLEEKAKVRLSEIGRNLRPRDDTPAQI